MHIDNQSICAQVVETTGKLEIRATQGGAPLFRNLYHIENIDVIAWRATRATLWARAHIFPFNINDIATRVRARGYFVASGVARCGARPATQCPVKNHMKIGGSIHAQP